MSPQDRVRIGIIAGLWLAGTLHAQCNFPFRQELTPANPNPNARFGFATAMSGDFAVIGAPLETTGGGIIVGGVHVFRAVGTHWEHQVVLMPDDPDPGAQFGFSVSISGSRIVVGAPFEDGAASNTGAVYVFEYDADASAWMQSARLTFPGQAAEDWFGYAVSVSGDALVAGAPRRDGTSTVDSGAAYAFQFDQPSQTWSAPTTLTQASPLTADQFGWSVAIAGNRILVGAPTDDVSGNINAGSATWFEFVSGTWVRRSMLTPDSPSSPAGDMFGHSVALSNTLAIIGAPKDDTAGGVDAGSAYAYLWTASGFSLTIHLDELPDAAGDEFGTSVSASDLAVVVGSPLDNGPVGSGAGVAWVHSWNGTGWAAGIQIIDPDGAANQNFAAAVAASGARVLAAGWPLGGSAALYTSEPAITHNPVDDTEHAGTQSAAFAVVTTGFYPTTFQWKHNGVTLFDGPSAGGGTIFGANTTSLIIREPGMEDAGAYVCTVTDPCGAINSAPATLSVLAEACSADVNRSGTVDFGDITEILERWALICP